MSMGLTDVIPAKTKTKSGDGIIPNLPNSPATQDDSKMASMSPLASDVNSCLEDDDR
jgi:hypothetical protein